jgi:hypothetical protein
MSYLTTDPDAYNLIAYRDGSNRRYCLSGLDSLDAARSSLDTVAALFSDCGFLVVQDAREDTIHVWHAERQTELIVFVEHADEPVLAFSTTLAGGG